MTRGLSSPSLANSPSVSSACSYCSIRVIRIAAWYRDDVPEILDVADPEDPRLQQVLERAVVLLQPELAQAEEGVGRSVLRRELDDAC